MLIALLPLQQQCALQPTLLLGKTLHHALPLGPRLGNPATDPVKRLFALGSCLDPQIDPQERMPATGHNGCIEPPSVQPTISEHQDLPVGWHAALQACQ